MANTADTPRLTAAARRDGHSVALGALLGVGLMGAIDEIVFHQLLHWHHLDDRRTPEWALVSDGILHAATLTAVVVALLLLASRRRRAAVDARVWTAGLLIGLGGFQLLDGTVNHKLLDLHEIRYGVALLPYDIAWNAGAVVLLAAGAALLLRARRPVG